VYKQTAWKCCSVIRCRSIVLCGIVIQLLDKGILIHKFVIFACRRKLQARLAEAEETIESLNQKVVALEKTKQRLSTEVEDLQLEVDRATAIANAAEKKQKAFDKIIGEWKLKVDDLAAELDASQKECRNYSTELFRLKGAYEEGQEQLEAVRRENKNLAGKHPVLQISICVIRCMGFKMQCYYTTKL
jgi:predicted  nucleic acid-binding Zn-ribbon protein